MKKIINEKNNRHGILTVKSKSTKSPYWTCLCDCGNTTDVLGYSLRSGNTKSCGCVLKNKRKTINKTHGLSSSPEYYIWQAMNDRCSNKNNKDYVMYSGRGIKVSEEWRCSFSSFIFDMGKRPSNKYSIDRIDNKLGYNKNNCRWATATEQARNKGTYKANKTGISGVRFSKSGKWISCISNKHLGTHETFLDACCSRKSAENFFWN